MALTTRARPGTRGAPTIHARDLSAECRLLEREVLRVVPEAQRAAAQAAVDASRPGTPGNPDKGARGWLTLYRVLHRMHAQHERSGTQAAAAEATARALRPAYDGVIADALREVPERVEVAPAHGKPGADFAVSRRHVWVYPKSHDALWFLACQSFRLRKLAADLMQVQQRAFLDNPALLERVAGEMAYRYHLIAWGATYPGCGLPFDPKEPPAPDAIPGAVRELAPGDLADIHDAFLRVNAVRLHALRTLYALTADPSDPVTKGEADAAPNWNQFFAVRSIEEGVAATTLYAERSLAAMIAAACVAADAREKAMEAAREEAEAEAKKRNPNGAPHGTPKPEGARG